MSHPFNAITRQQIASRCAAFPRLAADGATSGLKRAAVAIVLAKIEGAANATTLLLTLRASGLRAHSNQWALPGGRCDDGETGIRLEIARISCAGSDAEAGDRLALQADLCRRLAKQVGCDHTRFAIASDVFSWRCC
jgi:hypothetical protein